MFEIDDAVGISGIYGTIMLVVMIGAKAYTLPNKH